MSLLRARISLDMDRPIEMWEEGNDFFSVPAKSVYSDESNIFAERLNKGAAQKLTSGNNIK